MGIQLNGTSGTDVISAVDGSLTVEGLNVSGNFNITGNILGTQSQTFIGANTSDGSDNKSVMLAGGGASSINRGAYVWVKGNEYSGSGGELILAGGGVSSSLIDFYTNSGQRARITSTGELNIGGSYTQTTNKLNVTGTAYVSSDITAGDDIIAADEIRNNVPGDFWASDNTFISLNGYGNLTHQGGYQTCLTSNGYRTSTSAQWKSYAANSTTGAAQIRLDPTGYISFGTESNKSNGSTWVVTERLRIKSTGEVHISDRNSANAGEHVFQAGAFGIRMQDTGGYNRWNIERNYGGWQSTPVVHLSAQGRVGINESAPDHMFHIKGTSTDNNPVLAVESSSWASGKSAALRLSYTDGNAREIRGHYDHGLQFFINTGEAMRINTSGRIIFGPDAQDIQLIPHSTNSGHGQLYFRGNASNESSSIKLNHYGHADYVIGVGRHSNGMFSITRSDTGTDGLIMNTLGKIKIGGAPETLTGNGFNAKLQVNTGASNDYDGIMIGGGYTRSTIQNGATYDLILTSNAYPANATSKGIRFKCGNSGGGGPHERMRIHQSGMSEWRQHGGSKTYEYRSSVTGTYNQCIIIADCNAYHSFAIEVDISGYAYKYVWGKYYGYENGALYSAGNPGHQDRHSSSQYITHSHDGGNKHKFLCYISSATHPQAGIKITVGGPDAYIDDGDITFSWS